MNGLEQEYAGRIRFVRVDMLDAASKPLIAKYRAPGTPFLVFLNPQGDVVFRRGGSHAINTIRTDVERLAAELTR